MREATKTEKTRPVDPLAGTEHPEHIRFAQRQALVSTSIDLTGQRSGLLTAVEQCGWDEHGYWWRTRCACGNTREVRFQQFKERLVLSCGPDCKRSARIKRDMPTEGTLRKPKRKGWHQNGGAPDVKRFAARYGLHTQEDELWLGWCIVGPRGIVSQHLKHGWPTRAHLVVNFTTPSFSRWNCTLKRKAKMLGVRVLTDHGTHGAFLFHAYNPEHVRFALQVAGVARKTKANSHVFKKLTKDCTEAAKPKEINQSNRFIYNKLQKSPMTRAKLVHMLSRKVVCPTH